MRRALSFAMILGILALGGCTPRGADPSTISVEEPSEPATVAPREQVENPQYTSWAHFKKGTSVVHKAITKATGHQEVTTTTMTYTLLEREDTHVVVEMKAFTKRYDGIEIKPPPETFHTPRMMTLPPGVTRAGFAKKKNAGEQGEETIPIAGKTYKTKWHKSKDRNEAGEVLVQTWTSEEVPGALVKSITNTPAIGKTTTLEVIAINMR